MSRDFRATYRLQLTPDFGFREARALVPYLERLGVSHLYLSPSFQARAGSTHGYDVIDPRRVSDALGGENELRALAAAGLGIVLDIVPNHMAAADENPFWADPELRRTFFDLDTRTGLHRRFFDIGDLAGVRVEDEAVFATTHEKAFELVRDGVVDGLRIDHIDGLANPREYLDRLAREGVEHVWVEKILEPGERLRAWPVDGTTGYEFLNDVLHLFLNPRAEEPLTRLYEELTGESRTFEEVAAEAKLEQATGTFEPELRRLYAAAAGVENLAQALASFHVYRTYVEPEGDVVADEDRSEIARAALAESLERILLLDERGHDDFVHRFQQTTGPVMAKGVEDTTFYRYNRFVALNEVGGNPGAWELPVDTFHLANIERADRFPRHLLTAFTHDTKRSPDVRARLVALTWHADEWEEFARRELDFPDRNEGYFALQTLVGAWPIEHERIDAYFEKAFRESKLRTNWLDPDEAWEGRIKEWARSKRDAAGALARASPRRRRAYLAVDARPQTHEPRRAGHLPGRRGGGARARRPGQPAAGRLEPARTVARRGPAARAETMGDVTAPRAAARPPGGVCRRLHAGCRRAGRLRVHARPGCARRRAARAVRVSRGRRRRRLAGRARGTIRVSRVSP